MSLTSRIRIILIASLSLLIVAGANSQSIGYGLTYSKPITLESGKTVTVVADQMMHFSESTPAWLVYYETKIGIENMDDLEAESKEVFQYFTETIIEKDVTNVLVCSRKRTSTEGSIIKSSNGYNFLFKKNEEGSWYLYKNNT